MWFASLPARLIVPTYGGGGAGSGRRCARACGTSIGHLRWRVERGRLPLLRQLPQPPLEVVETAVDVAQLRKAGALTMWRGGDPSRSQEPRVTTTPAAADIAGS
jgi:hypothetical protein